MKSIFWGRPLSHQVNLIGHILSISGTFAFALAVAIRISEQPTDDTLQSIPDLNMPDVDNLYRRRF